MFVTITIEDVASLEGHGSVAQINGVDEDGRACIVYGEPRLILEAAQAAMFDEDEITLFVPEWALRYPAPTTDQEN